MLTDVDEMAFARFCEQSVIYRTAKDVLDVEGLYFESETGSVKTHPMVSVLYKAEASIQKYEREFGMTPASRVGLDVSAEAGVDALALFKQQEIV